MSILGVFKKDKDNAKPAPMTQKVVAAEPASVSKKSAPHSGARAGRAWKLLAHPLITEKATRIGAHHQYVFEVALKANKIEIAKAIAEVYGVHPVSVNMIRVSGKAKRFGRSLGFTKDRKKAVVTLKKGDTIQIYEGV